MFSIGEFARHGRVSVRMLRHYDAIGLLRPACVDRASGYRFYQASQLAELNRVNALKDLGFSLQQVQAILEENCSSQSMRLEDEHMPAAPEIVTRAEQPYVAIRAQVTMAELGGLGARFAEVFAWLGARGLAPAGAPFFRYDVIDMMRLLEVEAGVPVAAAVDGDGDVVSGVLPAGRYATLTHVGHPGELMAATKALLDWAADQGLRWDMSPGQHGERWGGRLEIYLTDPSQEPDMSKWETQLAFRLAD